MQEAALGLVVKGDSILLIKRQDVPVWVLPGGGIEPLESPESAAIREINEETGLAVSIVTHVATYRPINRLAATTYLYLCRPHRGALRLSEESSAVRFFPLNDLPSSLFYLHRAFIDEWKKADTFPLTRELTEVTYTKAFLFLLRRPMWVLRYLMTRWTKR